MSRLINYKKSINKFIKEKIKSYNISDDIKSTLNDYIEQNNMYISIILLTIYNNGIKKSGKDINGYHSATGIELLNFLNEFITSKDKYIKEDVTKFIILIITIIHNSFLENLMVVKPISDTNFYFLESLINETIANITEEHVIELNENNTTDMDRVKLNKKNKEKVKNIKTYKKNQLIDYIIGKYGSVIILAVTIGWILGGGDVNAKNKKLLKEIAHNLTIIFKIEQDISTLTNDIENSFDSCLNIVFNLGLIKSFKLYKKNKKEFIKKCMLLNIDSYTIKEILTNLEENITNFINNSTKISLDSTCHSV